MTRGSPIYGNPQSYHNKFMYHSNSLELGLIFNDFPIHQLAKMFIFISNEESTIHDYQWLIFMSTIFVSNVHIQLWRLFIKMIQDSIFFMVKSPWFPVEIFQPLHGFARVGQGAPAIGITVSSAGGSQGSKWAVLSSGPKQRPCSKYVS